MVVVAVGTGVVAAFTSLADIAFPIHFVFVHGEEKRLHHVLLWYVILWHAGLSAHACWHFLRLGSFPGEALMYTSPALTSHAELTDACSHTSSVLEAMCKSIIDGDFFL